MFDNLPVLQTKNVHDSRAPVFGSGGLVDVQNDIVAIGKYAFDRAVRVRQLFFQVRDEIAEAFGLCCL